MITSIQKYYEGGLLKGTMEVAHFQIIFPKTFFLLKSVQKWNEILRTNFIPLGICSSSNLHFKAFCQWLRTNAGITKWANSKKSHLILQPVHLMHTQWKALKTKFRISSKKTFPTLTHKLAINLKSDWKCYLYIRCARSVQLFTFCENKSDGLWTFMVSNGLFWNANNWIQKNHFYSVNPSIMDLQTIRTFTVELNAMEIS